MKNKTKEEAYLELLKPAETITFKVQNCVDELAAIRESPGDGFFIRYVPSVIPHPLLLLNVAPKRTRVIVDLSSEHFTSGWPTWSRS